MLSNIEIVKGVEKKIIEGKRKDLDQYRPVMDLKLIKLYILNKPET